VTYNPKRALELLRIGSGRADATFRDGQEDAIRHIVEGKGPLAGRSERPGGERASSTSSRPSCCAKQAGPALLISPLLALMRNQIAAAERMGVRAATINSDNQDDWTRSRPSCVETKSTFCLISPERLANERFRTQRFWLVSPGRFR
jgi:ATP-dependent DNA helicase RecQ